MNHTSLIAQVIESPVGKLLAVVGDEALVLLDFVDQPTPASLLQHIHHRVHGPASLAVKFDDGLPLMNQISQELEEYFAGERTEFSVPVSTEGSDFERQVWGFLQTIPFGQTRSYGQQARGIGTPTAFRAVGRANGLNPIAIVIPCHRVIGSNGSLTGYAGGLHRKRWLLEHEQRVLGLDLFGAESGSEPAADATFAFAARG